MSDENLKVVITGDASGLDQTSKQAAAALNNVSKSAAEWDKRARELNIQTNYTSRSFATLAASAKKVVTPVGQTGSALSKMSRSSTNATNSLFALSGIVQDAPYGFRAIANNITFFSQQMAYSAKASGGFGAALKAMGASFAGPAGIIFAISAGVSLLDTFVGGMKKADTSASDFAKKIKDLRESILGSSDAFEKASNSTDEQRAKLNLLYGAATDVTRSMNERLNAAKQLQSIFPKTFANINQEAIISGSAANAYKLLADNILQVAQAEANLQTIIENDKTSNKILTDISKQSKQYITLYNNLKNAEAARDAAAQNGGQVSQTMQGNVNKAREAYEDFGKQIIKQARVVKDLKDQNDQLAKSTNVINLNPDKTKGDSSKEIKTVASVLEDLGNKINGANALAKILGLTIEQVGSLKMKALSDAMNSLAYIATPAAIAQAKKLGDEYDAIGKASFLPELSGGTAKVNTPGIGTPGVPSFIDPTGGNKSLITDQTKLETAQQDAYNKALEESVEKTALLAGAFENVFSALANGGNLMQALLQAIEQVIIKLAAAAAAAAILAALTGGTSIAAGGFGSFAELFKGVSGIGSFLPHLAGGGYVPGPQLAVVGDAPGGEWVLNQRQISAILNGAGGGAREIRITGEFTQKGSDLVAAITNQNKRNNRIN